MDGLAPIRATSVAGAYPAGSTSHAPGSTEGTHRARMPGATLSFALVTVRAKLYRATQSRSAVIQGSIAPAEAESAGSSAVRRTKGSWPGTRWSGLRDRDGRARDVRPRNWASAKARRPAPSTVSSSSPSPRSPVSSAGATYLGPGLLAQAMRDAEELALASYVLRGPRAPRRGPRPRRRAWFSTPSTWADEVRTSRRIVGRPAAVRPEEVTLARRLIAEAGRLPARGLPRTAAGLGLSTAPPTRPGAGDPLRPPPGQPRPKWWLGLPAPANAAPPAPASRQGLGVQPRVIPSGAAAETRELTRAGSDPTRRPAAWAFRSSRGAGRGPATTSVVGASLRRPAG